MKATPENNILEYHESGAWSDVTLDDLFRKTAAAHPDRIAIADAPDRPKWTGGARRKLTYAEADKEIGQLAAFYRMVGLATDHVIGIHAPNTVDTVIAFLAALRAGLIVSPLPLHWRQKNVLEALNSIGAKGFVAADRVETRSFGTDARNIAAELFSLRFVFGLGKEVPDGLIALGPMLEEMGEGLVFEDIERPDAADQAATICWNRSGPENVPVSRCHNQWISAADLLIGEAGIENGASFILPYSLSGLTGLGAGFVPWLMCGGTLHLHHPTSLQNLAIHAKAAKADFVMTPGPLAQNLDRQLDGSMCSILAVWNISAPYPASFVPHRPLIDIQVADEFALVAKARGPSAKVKATALGKYLGPTGTENRPALLELAVRDAIDGTLPCLLVKGPMVPDVGWRSHPGGDASLEVDENGFLNTGIKVEPLEDGIAGFGVSGMYPVAAGKLESIDGIYAGYPGIREAAAFLVEDPVLGVRIYAALVPQTGTVPDVGAFFAFLDAEGVDLAKIPHRVLILRSLPRDADGNVDRAKLTQRTQRLPAAVA